MFDWQKLISEHKKAQKNFLSLPLLIKPFIQKNYQIIYENNLVRIRLYHLSYLKTNRAGLFVYSLVNKVDILDFSNEVSLIESLKSIYDSIYVIEWKEPTEIKIFHNMSDYIVEGIDLSIDLIIKYTNNTAVLVDLLGVCQGGVFALIFSAVFPKRINQLVLFMTPIDHQCLFKELELINFIQSNNSGIIQKETNNQFFSYLRPMKHYLGRYLDIALACSPKRKKLVSIESWLSQSMSLPSDVLKEYYLKVIKENRLVNGGLLIGNYKVNLMDVECPIINVYALFDQLVPNFSSIKLGSLVKAPYYEVKLKTGHIGIFTQKRYLNQFINNYKKILNNMN